VFLGHPDGLVHYQGEFRKLHKQGLNKMTDKISQTSKIKKKRLPKGQRTHIRRMKQEARKTGVTQT
jgi:hypothetical protein